MQHDRAYGKRILNWHQLGLIQLVYLSDLISTIEDVGSLYMFHETVVDYIQSDVIFYLDGTIPIGRYHDYNTTHATSIDQYYHHNYWSVDHDEFSIMDSLNVGFELLQQNPQRLVGYHSNQYEVHGDWNVLSFDDWNELLKNTTDVASVTSDTTTVDADADSSRFFVQICDNDAEGHSVVKETKSLQDDSGKKDMFFMQLSGTFLHKNYLCFLWHDDLKPLREMIQSLSQQYTVQLATDSSNTAGIHASTTISSNFNTFPNHPAWMELNSLFLSAVIPQLSSKLPLLYPLVKASWKMQDDSILDKNQRRRLNNIGEVFHHSDEFHDGSHDSDDIDDESLDSSSYSLLPRRRRRPHRQLDGELMNNRFHGFNQVSDTQTLNHRKLSSTTMNPSQPNVLSWRTTNAQHPRQKYQQQHHPPYRLSSQAIETVIKYFGTYMIGTKCWCQESKNRIAMIGNQNNCKATCHHDHELNSLMSEDLPWMNISQRSLCYP